MEKAPKHSHTLLNQLGVHTLGIKDNSGLLQPCFIVFSIIPISYDNTVRSRLPAEICSFMTTVFPDEIWAVRRSDCIIKQVSQIYLEEKTNAKVKIITQTTEVANIHHSLTDCTVVMCVYMDSFPGQWSKIQRFIQPFILTDWNCKWNISLLTLWIKLRLKQTKAFSLTCCCSLLSCHGSVD